MSYNFGRRGKLIMSDDKLSICDVDKECWQQVMCLDCGSAQIQCKHFLYENDSGEAEYIGSDGNQIILNFVNSDQEGFKITRVEIKAVEPVRPYRPEIIDNMR